MKRVETLGLFTALLALGALGCSDSDGSVGGEEQDIPELSFDGSPIDNMEDSDGSIITTDGRAGAWYTYNDETAAGTQEPTMGSDFAMTPVDPPRESSSYAARTVGSGFITWGAGLGVEIADGGAYDASGFTGIRFFAKAGPDGTKNIRFGVSEITTLPEGGLCDEAADTCYDHFGNDLTLTEDWQEFVLPFSGMAQAAWGTPSPAGAIDATQLYALEFSTETSGAFDFWIDDVAFYR
jgi:hypothetical protein